MLAANLNRYAVAVKPSSQAWGWSGSREDIEQQSWYDSCVRSQIGANLTPARLTKP